MASSGSFMEDDVHGSQQHNAVTALKLPPAPVSSPAELVSKFHRYTILGPLSAWGWFQLTERDFPALGRFTYLAQGH